jgi:hypothetical protein
VRAIVSLRSCGRATCAVLTAGRNSCWPRSNGSNRGWAREVVFRADAAFAKPEIYEALEERGVRYAIHSAGQ